MFISNILLTFLFSSSLFDVGRGLPFILSGKRNVTTTFNPFEASKDPNPCFLGKRNMTSLNKKHCFISSLPIGILRLSESAELLEKHWEKERRELAHHARMKEMEKKMVLIRADQAAAKHIQEMEKKKFEQFRFGPDVISGVDENDKMKLEKMRLEEFVTAHIK